MKLLDPWCTQLVIRMKYIKLYEKYCKAHVQDAGTDWNHMEVSLT
jgi:hypothetical protein